MEQGVGTDVRKICVQWQVEFGGLGMINLSIKEMLVGVKHYQSRAMAWEKPAKGLKVDS